MQFRWYEYFVVLAPEVCTVAHHTDEHIHFDAQVRVAGKKIKDSLVCTEVRLIYKVWSQRSDKSICNLLRRLTYNDVKTRFRPGDHAGPKTQNPKPENPNSKP